MILNTKSRTPLLVGFAALVISGLVVLRILAGFGWDVSVFAAFGEDEVKSRAYAEERLGDVYLRDDLGHDGKFFFIQANDPLFLEPEVNAAALDRPLYRSQRMLYPLIAGAGGLFTPELILWSMLIVNLLAMGLGSYVVAHLAREMGGSPWWGLAFVLNIGFISEMTISGAGVVSAVAAFGAVLFLLRSKNLAAYIMLLLAALAREAMLIAAVGSAIWLYRRGDRVEASKAILIPGGGVLIWAIYLRLRIGWASGVEEVREIGIPFRGFIGAFENWGNDGLDLAVGLAMMLLMLLFARRVLTSNALVGWVFAGFVLLGVVFTTPVWNSYFDISRAIAPVITAFVLMVALDRQVLTE